MLSKNAILFSIPFVVALLLTFGWFLFGSQLFKYVFIAIGIFAIVGVLTVLGVILVDEFGDGSY